MQIRQALDAAKGLVTQIIEDEVPDLAAGLAYRFLFAIFPFAIFLAALAGFAAPMLGMGDPTNEILGALADNLPPDVAAQLRPQLEAVLGTTRPGLLSIGAVTALWAATGGISAVIGAMNKAYDVEETRGFIPRTGVALGLTILGTIGIVAAFVTIVGGSILTERAVTGLGVDPEVWTAASWLRFPVVLLVVTLAVAVLFRLGPNVRVSFRWTLVGGATFAVTWLLGTVAFGVYVANFASYADTYGALGGVVVLMLWFYLTGLMLLVAAEVTAILATRHEPERIEARRQELGSSVERPEVEPAGAPVQDEAGSRTDGPAGPGRNSTPTLVPAERAPAVTARDIAGREGPVRSGSAIALAVLALGAIAGAMLGHIAGDGDEQAASR